MQPRVEAVLATGAHSDTRPVLMMTADLGFGRIGEVRRVWVPPGIRPIVAKQIVREYIYAFVAVAPALAEMTALVLPDANTQMMNLFLEQVAIEFAVHHYSGRWSYLPSLCWASCT